jgi:hypothetical protein
MTKNKSSKLEKGFRKDGLTVQGSSPGKALTQEQRREFDNYFRGEGMSREFAERHYRLSESLSISPSDKQLRELLRY